VRGKAAVHFPVESDLVRKLQRAYTSKTGLDATPRSMGWRDLRQGTAEVVAFGTRFLDEPELAHRRTNEFLDRMRLAMKILAEAMVLLAQ
jgi:acetylornithine deacetylase/succinyl-diaminopimelate desuccinylase-like protein